MKKSKILAVLVVSGVFMAFAMGSGGKSTHDSVKIEADDSTDEISETDEADDSSSDEASATDEATEDESQIKYEISDTSFEYYTNSIGNIEYYGFVEITNTGNCDIYMKDCVFDMEDNDGHLLQSDDFISHVPEVIAPGEKGYFYNGLGASTIDSSVSFENGIQLVPQLNLQKANGKPHSYPVSDITYRAGDYDDIKVTGRVENDTDEEQKYLGITIVFLDADGKAIAFDSTSITSAIAPGNMGSFDTSSMFSNENLKLDNVNEVLVICEDTYYQF